jgi:hypothetical protein
MSFAELLRHLMPRSRDGADKDTGATGSKSHDRALASFKADLAKRAEKNTRHIPEAMADRVKRLVSVQPVMVRILGHHDGAADAGIAVHQPVIELRSARQCLSVTERAACTA